MKKLLIIAAATSALFACESELTTDVAREAAKAVLTPIVQKQFPGQNSEMVVECALDNASTQEILTLAASTATANSEQVATTSTQLLAKPATLECIAKGLIGLS